MPFMSIQRLQATAPGIGRQDHLQRLISAWIAESSGWWTSRKPSFSQMRFIATFSGRIDPEDPGDLLVTADLEEADEERGAEALSLEVVADHERELGRRRFPGSWTSRPTPRIS